MSGIIAEPATIDNIVLRRWDMWRFGQNTSDRLTSSLRLSAYLCVLGVMNCPLTQRTQRYAEDAEKVGQRHISCRS